MLLENVPVLSKYLKSQANNVIIQFCLSKKQDFEFPSRAPACWVTPWRHWQGLSLPRRSHPSFSSLVSSEKLFLKSNFFWELSLHTVALVHGLLGANWNTYITHTRNPNSLWELSRSWVELIWRTSMGSKNGFRRALECMGRESLSRAAPQLGAREEASGGWPRYPPPPSYFHLPRKIP